MIPMQKDIALRLPLFILTQKEHTQKPINHLLMQKEATQLQMALPAMQKDTVHKQLQIISMYRVNIIKLLMMQHLLLVMDLIILHLMPMY
jgi:hypothetical protein